MSAISSNFTSGSQVSSTPDAYSSLSSGDFLKIIFTELTNQDPLAPSETKDLLEQLSTIRAIQSDVDLGERLESMAKQNEITSSSSLVGKFVTGKTASGSETAGYVDSVSITRDGPVLNLSSGTRVPLKSLTEVIDPSLLEGISDNQAPIVSEKIPDQSAAVGSAWSFTVPRQTFSDEDVDSLTYSATLESGDELPEWIDFNPVSRVFTGTPPEDAPALLSLKVTAIDSYNKRASTAFGLAISGGSESGGETP